MQVRLVSCSAYQQTAEAQDEKTQKSGANVPDDCGAPLALSLGH